MSMINHKTPHLPREVVVLPRKAADREEANQQLSEAQDLFQDLGVEITNEIKGAGALTAQTTEEQMQALKEAGFQVVENKKVNLVPKQPTLKNLQAGWLAQPEALEALKDFPFLNPFWPSPRRPERRPQVDRKPEGPSDYVGQLPTTGKGVTIAIIDSGVYPHPDLGERFLGNVSPIQRSRPYRIGKDPVGHGTHVAGDAAGDGTLSNGRIQGPAPEANILGIQVLDESEYETDVSRVLQDFTDGIDWMVDNRDEYNIKVANLSLALPLFMESGGFFGPDLLYDPIGAAINRAVQAGITVVAAAGNEGPAPGTITGTPAINENIITVGALDTNGTPRDKRDDRVAEFSSRGPTPDGRVKPDILAPGVMIMAANSPGSEIEQQNELFGKIQEATKRAGRRELAAMAYALVEEGILPPDVLYMDIRDLKELFENGLKHQPTIGRLEGGAAYIGMDGTSMATPIVSGVVAAMYEANPDLTPAEVKEILKRTAEPVGRARQTSQGAGAIDAQKAVEVAARLAQARV